jgi:hypothetical protein
MTTDRITTKREKRHVVRAPGVAIDSSDVELLKRDLDVWLESRTAWTHEEWMGLLTDLREKGYTDLIDTPRGQETIGAYLESNRRNVQ